MRIFSQGLGLLMVLLTLGAMAGTGATPTPLEHRFQEGESLWFLSQIYYGQGAEYRKIMDANHLASPDRVRHGQLLVIPDPLFKPEQPGFEIRLSHLREKRAEALSHRAVANVPEEASTLEKARAEVGGR